jgi:hypothetical protein
MRQVMAAGLVATKRTVLLSVGALLLCLAIETDRVHACSCMRSGSPCQEAWRTDAVFAGRVVGLTEVVEQRDRGDGLMYDMWNFRVRMRVTEAFRGDMKDAVDVFTPASEAACGYGFSVNRSYLVYAYWHKANKRWEASICSRTRPLEQASEDLAYLRGPARQPCPGQLVGAATRQDLDPADEHRQLWTKPFPNARVLIESVEAPPVRSTKRGPGRTASTRPACR